MPRCGSTWLVRIAMNKSFMKLPLDVLSLKLKIHFQIAIFCSRASPNLDQKVTRTSTLSCRQFRNLRNVPGPIRGQTPISKSKQEKDWIT